MRMRFSVYQREIVTIALKVALWLVLFFNEVKLLFKTSYLKLLNIEQMLHLCKSNKHVSVS